MLPTPPSSPPYSQRRRLGTLTLLLGAIAVVLTSLHIVLVVEWTAVQTVRSLGQALLSVAALVSGIWTRSRHQPTNLLVASVILVLGGAICLAVGIALELVR